MTKIGDDLIQSLGEAIRMANGEEIGRIVSPEPFAVRKKARLTQKQMAALMGMSVSGYRKWEQGTREISGPAANLLRLIELEPEAVKRALST